MTGLLPQVIHDAVRSESDYSASESFGVVTLVLLMVIVVEREVLRVARLPRPRIVALTAAVVPLSVAVALTITVRIADLF